MSTPENQVKDSASDATTSKSQRITTVAWLTGVTAVVALMTLNNGASVGVSLGVTAVSGMVAFVSYLLLRA